MSIKEKLIVMMIALLAHGVVSSSVNAASWRACSGNRIIWNEGKANMYVSTTSMPIGSVWDLHAQYTMSEWNAVNGSNFTFYVGRDTDGSHSSSNGTNEVYFEYQPDESYLGLTKSRWNCFWFFGWHHGYLEADVGINTRFSWTAGDYTGNVTGSPYSYDLVMLHELGHALGLEHSDGKPATMNTYYSNGGPIGHYNKEEPHGDDRFGLRILYPNGSSGRDVSVSRFRNIGGGDVWVNKVTRTNGSNTTSLRKGSNYRMKYTLENLGTQTESANIKFYISTNTYISTADTFVGSTTWSMPSGSYATADKTFNVPTSLATGYYYVGYRVDPNNTIPETDESNNFVSLLHRVYIY